MIYVTLIISIFLVCNCSRSPLHAEDLNTPIVVSCFPVYDRYTIHEGQTILAKLSLLGYTDVESFQKAAGLSIDGIAGPATCHAVNKMLPAMAIHTATEHENIILIEVASLDELVQVSIVNSSRRSVILAPTGGLVAGKAGVLAVNLPISLRTSGKDLSGKLFRDGARAYASFSVPQTIPPLSTVKATVKVRNAGEGISQLQVRFVAVFDSKNVRLVTSKLLSLPKVVSFAE